MSSLTCKICGYKSSDSTEENYFKKKYKDTPLHDIFYVCGVCLDNMTREEYENYNYQLDDYDNKFFEIVTKNSKTLSNGQRLNLVINHGRKEFFYSGCHAFDLGVVENNLLKRDIFLIRETLRFQGYREVSHNIVKIWYNNWRL
jgi:uncharacterized CHY-type Zn-finger protein